jgi:hypothetical protein
MIPSKNYYNHARRSIFEECSICPATLLPLSFESKDLRPVALRPTLSVWFAIIELSEPE